MELQHEIASLKPSEEPVGAVSHHQAESGTCSYFTLM